jgi:hypothetical protein
MWKSIKLGKMFIFVLIYLLFINMYKNTKDINDNFQFSVDVFFGRAQIGLLWLTLDKK